MSDTELKARLRVAENKRGWVLEPESEKPIGLVRPKRGERFHESADAALKAWAFGFITHDRREIKQATGNGGGSALGRDVKRNNKDNHIYEPPAEIEISDEQYRRLNTVVLSLSPPSFYFINLHYVERNNMPVVKFIRDLPITKTAYYEEIRDARNEFIARGGIS